jgi:integrase
VKKDKGQYSSTVTKATLAVYLRGTWLPFYSTKARSTTVYNAETVLGKWILNAGTDLGVPLIGRIPLRKLTPKDFTALYVAVADAKREKPLQRRGIEHLHSLLHRALEHAVRQGDLSSNPTHYAAIPTPEVNDEVNTQEDEDESEVQYLALEQARRFRVAARQQVDPKRPDTYRWPALWLLLLDSGMRPGEALALKWRHIDSERQMVTVASAMSRLRNEERKARGQSWSVKKPKTKGSKDSVPVCAETIEVLEEWRAKQAELKKDAGDLWQDHGFVFTTEVGAPIGNNIRRAWLSIMRAADGGVGDLGTWAEQEWKVVTRKAKTGRKKVFREGTEPGPKPLPTFTPQFSPYVLRHTCATLLIENGMDLYQVSLRLRNSLAICAKHYSHVKAKHTTQAVEVWDRLFAIPPLLKLA